jgi:polyisoprenoid-binding protein YceI
MRASLLLVVLLILLSGGAAFAAGVPLVLDRKRSVVEVEVRDTFGSFTGRLQDFEATVSVDAAKPVVESAWVEFKFADLRTGRPRRDRDMMEWENSADHPSVEFRLERLETTPDGPVRARGRLAMHGVEHSVLFPVIFLVQGSVWAIDGEVELDHRDYGLPVIRKYYILSVDPHLRVRFHLQGKLSTAAVP